MTFAHIPVNALACEDDRTGAVYEGWPSSGEGSGIKVLRLSNFAERAACAECGTVRLGAWKDVVGILVATVDEPLDGGEEVAESLKAKKAIFVGSAPSWVDASEAKLGIKTCERFDVGVEEDVVKGRVDGG
jgi:hypothetical protein